jgi:hypothetical protein
MILLGRSGWLLAINKVYFKFKPIALAGIYFGAFGGKLLSSEYNIVLLRIIHKKPITVSPDYLPEAHKARIAYNWICLFALNGRNL